MQFKLPFTKISMTKLPIELAIVMYPPSIIVLMEEEKQKLRFTA